MCKPQTSVSFRGTRILINGRPTYEGCENVEGLRFNVRTVNATFDDTLGRVNWWDDDGSRPENEYAGYGPWRSPEDDVAPQVRSLAKRDALVFPQREGTDRRTRSSRGISSQRRRDGD